MLVVRLSCRHAPECWMGAEYVSRLAEVTARVAIS